MKRDALYYRLKPGESFEAMLISCEEAPRSSGKDGCLKDGGFLAVLGESGFYPEGGGQPSDTGRLGEARVLHVEEKEDGTLLHTLDRPLLPGRRYTGTPDWGGRRRNTQNHSGEHIISGLVHRRFGYDNTGFHMNMDTPFPFMTIDFNGALSWEQLRLVEEEANRIIWENRPVRELYPEREELSALSYRSKRELTGDVRIIEVEGADLCACCGTHVERTGEIGLIRILSVISRRGGSRVELCCGESAYLDASEKLEAAREAARLLSAKPRMLPEAIGRVLSESHQKDLRIAELNRRYFEGKAQALSGTLPVEAVLCEFEEGLNAAELRSCCDILMRRSGARLVAVFCEKEAAGEPSGAARSRNPEIPAASGGRKEYLYVIGSLKRDVREGGRELNRRLSGRGGGQAEMIQGSVRASEAEIREAVREIWDSTVLS